MNNDLPIIYLKMTKVNEAKFKRMRATKKQDNLKEAKLNTEKHI